MDKDFLSGKETDPWNHIVQELRRRLNDLAETGHHATRDIRDLQNCMHDLSSRQQGQLTTEQVIALSALLLMRERKSWLLGRLRLYTITSVSIIGGIYVFRMWIADVLTFLAALFKAN